MKPDAAIAWDDALKAWRVCAYHDVVAVLRDDRFTAADARAADREGCPSQADPTQEGLRRHVSAAMAGSLTETRRLMEAEADSILDETAPARSVDLAQDLITPWCRRLAIRLSGEDAGDRASHAKLIEAADSVFQLAAAPPGEDASPGGHHDGTVYLAGFFLDQLRRSRVRARERPDASLLGQLTAGPHAETELIAFSVQLFVGLVTSLPLLLGNILHQLYRQPVTGRGDAGANLCPRALNELLRVAGPAQTVYRLATARIRIGGHTFESGDRIALSLAEANRDAGVFARAREAVPGREEAPHVSLGMGRHSCLGAPLIREACTRFPARILERFPRELWTIDARSIRLGGHATISGFTALPLLSRGASA